MEMYAIVMAVLLGFSCGWCVTVSWFRNQRRCADEAVVRARTADLEARALELRLLAAMRST